MATNQERFVNPYTDFGFKRLFGTEPNKEFLISFLNALFQGRRSPIVDIKYLNTAVLGPYYGDRNSVFDVYCETQDKGQLIVEMQRSDQPYFKDRTVYYGSAAVVHQAPKGEWDYCLKEVCIVGILNFVFPNHEYGGDSYFHEVKLKDVSDNHVVYDKLTFYYLEMPKFDKGEDELETMLDKWLFVVKNICHLLEQPKELQERVFTEFFEEARIARFTPEEQFAYEESRKHYWDNLNTLNYSYDKGKMEGKEEGLAVGRKLGVAEGRELGVAENRRETARRMLSMGMEKETVLQVTGLTEEELSALGDR